MNELVTWRFWAGRSPPTQRSVHRHADQEDATESGCTRERCEGRADYRSSRASTS